MKVGGDQVVLVPRLSIFGGDASHGSHRVVAPMFGIVSNEHKNLPIILVFSRPY